METYELEEEVRAALKGNADLMAVLPNGENAIYHHVAPTVAPTSYPIVVYSPISDVPILSGDNREMAHRVTFRIHVIASQKRFELEENKFKAACKLILEIMTGIGFFRHQTTPFLYDGKIMSVIDFVKGVKL